MTCLLRNKENEALLNEYEGILGSREAAYYALSQNNGYPLDKDLMVKTPHCIRIYYSVMEVVEKKPYWRRLLYLHLSLQKITMTGRRMEQSLQQMIQIIIMVHYSLMLNRLALLLKIMALERIISYLLSSRKARLLERLQRPGTRQNMNVYILLQQIDWRNHLVLQNQQTRKVMYFYLLKI